MQRAQHTATTAASELTALQERLDANAHQRQEYDTALQALMERQSELTAAIEERDRLRHDRKNAERHATTAHRDARAAESKYDKALLAQMLRQEKSTDLSSHDDSATPAATRTPRRGTATPVKPADTAVATAASVTRRRARPHRHAEMTDPAKRHPGCCTPQRSAGGAAS